jgi:hypothetical protein
VEKFPALWAVGLLGAGLTAFYMARLVSLTFFVRAKDEHGHHIFGKLRGARLPVVRAHAGPRLGLQGPDETFGPWSTYGHLRLTVDFAIPLAIPIGRLYAAAGPSLVVLAKNLSTTRVAPGGFGFVGIELFAGDGLQTFPVAFFFQVGGVAHAASADVERRTGTPVASETAVNRAVATGFAMEGGVRFYGWR